VTREQSRELQAHVKANAAVAGPGLNANKIVYGP
jgi:hypothetical protein